MQRLQPDMERTAEQPAESFRDRFGPTAGPETEETLSGGVAAPARQTLWLLRRGSLRVRAVVVERAAETQLTLLYGGVAASRQSFGRAIEAVRAAEALHERLWALEFRRERPDANPVADAGRFQAG